MSAPAPALEHASTGRRLGRLLPELVALLLCVVLWVQAGELTTTADGPGPAFFPRVVLGLLTLALLIRLGHEWTMPRQQRLFDDEGLVVPDDVVSELPVSRRRLALGVALAVGYVAGTVAIGWVLATFAFVVVFLFAAGARRLTVTVPVSAALTVGLAYVFGTVVYLSLPVGAGVFAELTLRFFEALGVY